MPPKLSLMEKKRATKRKFPDIEIDKHGKVTCSVCIGHEIKYDDNHGNDTLKNHMESQKHKRMKGGSRQTMLLNAFEKAKDFEDEDEKFCFELTEAFVAANIPLSKLENPVLKCFLEKSMKRKIPERTKLQTKVLDKVFNANLVKVKEVVGDNPIFLIVDETTDACGRFALNILVGKLDGRYDKPMLLCTKFLEATNSETVSQAIISACGFLWDGQILYNKLSLVLSDQAAYMIKAIGILKPLFNNLHHITCLAHSLHRVCEAIRSHYKVLDSFVSNMKKVLLKSSYRRNLFKTMTRLSLPPVPVLTRWGTWINSAFFSTTTTLK
jgi:hypothetical protein